MNSLASAIRSLGLSGTASEVRTALGSAGTPITDATSYSLSGLADKLMYFGVSVEVLIDLRSHIATLPVGGNTLEGLLITGGGAAGGVNFSRADIRTQIAYNQGHPSTTEAQQAVLAGMLLVGSVPRTKWQQAGLGSLPTEEQITVALEQIASETWKDAAIQTLESMAAGGEASVADMKAAIAALEG